MLVLTFIATLACVLLPAGLLYAVRKLLIAKHRSPQAFSPRLFWGALITTCVATLVIWTSSLFGSVATIAVPVSLTALALFEVTDFTSFQYFDDSILDIVRCLPVRRNAHGVGQVIRAYGVQYFPLCHFACVLAILVAAFVAMAFAGWIALLSPAWVFAGLIAAAFARRYRPRPKKPPQLSFIEQAYLSSESQIQRFPLRRSARRESLALSTTPAAMPRTVLIIINESAGAHLPSSRNPHLSLIDQLRALSGSPQTWFVPSNAVSNSNCTDISIPSLLTGTGAHESVDKLHELPFLFDIAKARGFHTLFFTSLTLDWGNLDAFFAAAGIDEMFTADSSAAPIVNDMGIDDYIPAQRLALRLEQSEEPLFAVLYVNALHVPFQAASICDIPATIDTRRNRAIFLTERAHKLLFDALRSSARYDDALIISIGDHGELPDAADDVGVRAARLTQLGNSVVRPLFLLKPPQGLPKAMTEALALNKDALVANIDIAPTIAQLFGTTLTGGLRYAGHSMFGNIPRSRVVYALNTNEWHFWHRTAAAIFRGNGGLVFDYQSKDLLSYRGDTPCSSEERDELLAQAFDIKTMRAAIARIYQDKLGYKKRASWQALISPHFDATPRRRCQSR